MVLEWEINGETIIVEDNEVGVEKRAEFDETGPLEKVIKKITNKTFDNVFGLIPYFSKKILGNLPVEGERPSEISCSYSLGFNAEGNIVFVKAGANAQLTIKLKWTPKLVRTKQNSGG